GCLALDSKGFIKTGPGLSHDDLAAAEWPLARPPHLLETSLPGVFAVGDVRGGSLKRVASAVGEGFIAVAFVHQFLGQCRKSIRPVLVETVAVKPRRPLLRPNRNDLSLTQ